MCEIPYPLQLLCWFLINTLMSILWDHNLTLSKITQLEELVHFFVPLFRAAYPDHAQKPKVSALSPDLFYVSICTTSSHQLPHMCTHTHTHTHRFTSCITWDSFVDDSAVHDALKLKFCSRFSPACRFVLTHIPYQRFEAENKLLREFGVSTNRQCLGRDMLILHRRYQVTAEHLFCIELRPYPPSISAFSLMLIFSPNNQCLDRFSASSQQRSMMNTRLELELSS